MPRQRWAHIGTTRRVSPSSFDSRWSTSYADAIASLAPWPGEPVQTPWNGLYAHPPQAGLTSVCEPGVETPGPYPLDRCRRSLDPPMGPRVQQRKREGRPERRVMTVSASPQSGVWRLFKAIS